MKSDEFRKILLLIVVIGGALPALASATALVSIQDVSLNVSESVTVPIMINGVSGVKGAHIVMSYDPSIVHVTDIGNSAFSMLVDKTIDNSTGRTRYSVINLDNLSGDVRFADVTLKAVGYSGRSPLNLTIISLNSGTGEITNTVKNGTFTIAQPTSPPGASEPAIISWGNTRTGDRSTSIIVNVSETLTFNATANQTITTWKWFMNGTDQNNNADSITRSFASTGIFEVKVNATNTNGTTEPVVWNVNVREQQPVINSSMDVTVDAENKVTTPNANVTYLIKITNDGNVLDNYTLTPDIPAGAKIDLSDNRIEGLGPGGKRTVRLNVSSAIPGKYRVIVTVTGDSGASGSVSTTTTVLAANISGFIPDTTGIRSKWINASVNVTNYEDTSQWFVIVVTGVNADGYPLAATATVRLNGGESLSNIPVVITIPPGAPTGNYDLFAGIWKFDEFPVPEKLITAMGPKTVTIS